MANIFLPEQIFANLPKYDGKSSASEWLKLYNDRCQHLELDEHWKLVHMDRILEGTAKHWWSFSQGAIMAGLSRHNSANRLQTFIQQLKRDFPEADDIKLASKENSSVKFDPSIDQARDYVFRKRAIFARMDAAMTEAKQLEHLYEGLPSELRWTIKRQLGARGTVQQFLSELICFAEEFNKLGGEKRSDIPASKELYSSVGACASTTATGVSSTANASTSNLDRTNAFLHSLPSNLLTPNVTINCGYCGIPGHAISGCELHKRHFTPRYDQDHRNDKRDSGSSKTRWQDRKPYDRDHGSEHRRRVDHRQQQQGQKSHNAGNDRA